MLPRIHGSAVGGFLQSAVRWRERGGEREREREREREGGESSTEGVVRARMADDSVDSGEVTKQ